jgi:hypothetical protein
LSDNANNIGTFSVIAIPLKDPSTESISIDSVVVTFGLNQYLIDESGLKVKYFFFNLSKIFIIKFFFS